MTQGTPPPPTSARAAAARNGSGLTAAAWNRRSPEWRARGLAHWPHWLRAIAETERASVLMRLFAVLFLLLPGTALLISTYRRASAVMTLAVLAFTAVHAALHALAAWRMATPRPLPALLRRADVHATRTMLAGTLLLVALVVNAHDLPVVALAAVLAGALCQLCSLRVAHHRLWHALLVLGSGFQFIGVALISASAGG